MVLFLALCFVPRTQLVAKTVDEAGTQIAYKHHVDRLAACNAQLAKMMNISVLGDNQFHPRFNDKLKECSELLVSPLPKILIK